MPGRFIWSVAISPDGKVLATADNDAVVRLLEFETRREIQELSYLQGGYRVAFARNGHLLAIGARGAIRLFDWSEGKARPAVEGHRGQVVCSVFTPDSTRLLGAGNEETWATVWDVAREVARPVVPRPRAEPAALQRWWQELGKDDPAAGYRAVWELVARPGQSVPLLKESLRPAPAADARQVARLLKGLEDKRFAERDRARRELEKLGEAAEGDLREALAGSPSLEQRRRIEELLEKLEAVPKSAEQLRGLRAVFVLEQIGSREAREVLEKLANGGAGRVLTRDAQTALHRLARRPVVP